MARPTDWWVLDLAGDPAPGAPAPIAAIARSWDQMAEDAEHAERQLRTLMSDDAVGRWIGEAGQTFREQAGELPGQLATCAASYLMAAQALERWAEAVATHQGTADAALVRGRDARAALERARSEAALAAADLAQATVAPSAEVVREATERHHAAVRAHDLAAGQVDAAQAVFDLERQLALDAAELHAGDADECARRIHEASDAGIGERSRWEKAKDALAEAWEFLVSVARFVVTGLAVLALIFGGPLTWLFLAAAFVLLADGIARWLQGRASLWEALVGMLGHGSPDRSPSERVTIPSGPAAAAAWWAGLSPAQRERAILEHPELVGRTDGIPAEARDRANRALLPAYRAQLEAELARGPGRGRGHRRDRGQARRPRRGGAHPRSR